MASFRRFFSDAFGVLAETIDDYGAFNICLLSDLPLFIDPFLLFQSEKPEYQRLHSEIIAYLRFLLTKSQAGVLDSGRMKEWLYFKEVKQNWLGSTFLGNEGHGLGAKFAVALNGNLARGLETSGTEPHLEKVGLLTGKVGLDGISDFTTNLIKHWLLTYTQAFAQQHVDPALCRNFTVPRAQFDYENEVWSYGRYLLPEHDGDFVILEGY